MDPSLVKIFNEAAREAHDAFPDRLKNLVVMSTGMDQEIFATPDMAAHMKADVDALKTALKRVEKDFTKLNGAAGYATPFFSIGGKSVKMIALKGDPPGLYTQNFTKEMRGLYILDHEIGHHVVKGGWGIHLRECEADAYAALRHIQRFGNNDTFFEYTNKAYVVVLGSSSAHYSEDVLQNVRQVATEMDLTKLTPQETTELAAQIAGAHRMDGTRLAKLEMAFAPAVRVYRKEIGDKVAVTDKLYGNDPAAYALFVQETMKVVEANPDSHDVAVAAKRFFSYPPMKAFINSSDEWKAARDITIPPPPAPPAPESPAANA